jgi:hypothetical protein
VIPHNTFAFSNLEQNVKAIKHRKASSKCDTHKHTRSHTHTLAHKRTRAHTHTHTHTYTHTHIHTLTRARKDVLPEQVDQDFDKTIVACRAATQDRAQPSYETKSAG